MITEDKIKLKVGAIEEINPTLKKITFMSLDGEELPLPMPGAHIVLDLPCEKGLRHNAYSLITESDTRHKYEIIVRKSAQSRGGSAYVHEGLKVGDEIMVSVPISLFAPQNRARKHLLIGGGIGITPLLSLMAAMKERGDFYEFHQIVNINEIEDFKQIFGDYYDYRINLHAGSKSIDFETLLKTQPLGTHIYCCGPEAMIEDLEAAAITNGWPKSSFHSESFGVAGGDPFEVKIAKTGQIIKVGEDESMLEALEAANLDVPCLCRGGACGVCVTKVVDGTPDHKDHYLNETEKEEGTLIMPCVSRAKSSCLTIDI